MEQSELVELPKEDNLLILKTFQQIKSSVVFAMSSFGDRHLRLNEFKEAEIFHKEGEKIKAIEILEDYDWGKILDSEVGTILKDATSLKVLNSKFCKTEFEILLKYFPPEKIFKN